MSASAGALAPIMPRLFILWTGAVKVYKYGAARLLGHDIGWLDIAVQHCKLRVNVVERACQVVAVAQHKFHGQLRTHSTTIAVQHVAQRAALRQGQHQGIAGCILLGQREHSRARYRIAKYINI